MAEDVSEQNAYSAFQSFNETEWKEWLSAFLLQDRIPPYVPSTNEPPHSILIRVFENLEPKSNALFNRALFRQFEETAIIHKNAFQFYTLLHVISCTLPGQVKPLLRRRLREGVFRRLNFEGQNLHDLLLAACSKFDVDDELARWIQRSAANSRNFDYLLLCQWVLSTVEDDQAYYFTERLLPFMNDADHRAEATRQLFSIALRLGYGRFLNWYRDRSNTLHAKWRERWEVFVKSLKERLLSDRALPKLATIDRDAVFLYAELRLSRNRIPLDTVLEIARLHRHLGTDEAIAMLVEIWNDLFDRTNEAPWEYTAPQEKYMAKAANQGTIFYRTAAPAPIQQRNVEAGIEKETDEVLLEVRKQCELMTLAAKRA